VNSNRQHDSVLVEHGRETEDATGSQVEDALLWSTSEGMA